MSYRTAKLDETAVNNTNWQKVVSFSCYHYLVLYIQWNQVAQTFSSKFVAEVGVVLLIMNLLNQQVIFKELKAN